MLVTVVSLKIMFMTSNGMRLAKFQAILAGKNNNILADEYVSDIDCI